MKIFVERIIIKNRAPFESLDLTFNENEIAVLTAVNGRGKTTILSYIVDAWYELVRSHFRNEFEGKENKYYRVSSPLYDLNRTESSFVYIRFKTSEGNIDYIDVRNECTEQQYNELIPLVDKIPFNKFIQTVKDQGNIKLVQEIDSRTSPSLHKSLDKKEAENIFENNVITYFPAYRYETPGYLNDSYKIHLDFTKESGFSGYLPNPLEVVTGLPQLANWIMDVVLDMDLYKETQNINGQIFDITPERNVLWQSLNTIIKQTLISKNYQGKIRFGIGKRNSGGSRISIMNDKVIDGKNISEQIYPTIFNLSSGEAVMLCMFGEILRQADKNRNNIALQQISGIVLIDEIDKHLHIKLQKEILPLLFNLFPNVQFIVSSHSPFLNMGLAELNNNRARIIDLDQNGLIVPLQKNELYKQVYEMMINENENYKKSLEELSQQNKPILFVEDCYTQIYKVAYLKLNDIDFDESNIGDQFNNNANFNILSKGNKDNLQGFLNNPCMNEWTDKIIAGLFDFDDAYINYEKLKTENNANPKWEEKETDETKCLYKKRTDCNVYGIMLPIPDFRKNIAGKDYKLKQLEVELLFTDDSIQKAYGASDCAIEKINNDLSIPKINNKADFWKKTLNLDKSAFVEFQPIFNTLNIIYRL